MSMRYARRVRMQPCVMIARIHVSWDYICAGRRAGWPVACRKSVDHACATHSPLGGGQDPAYPGGPFFNLFNLGKDEAALADLKLKEIKNGRLAMIAMFGYGAQAVLTGVGPYQNLADHVTSAGSANILSNLVSAAGGN